MVKEKKSKSPESRERNLKAKLEGARRYLGVVTDRYGMFTEPSVPVAYDDIVVPANPLQQDINNGFLSSLSLPGVIVNKRFLGKTDVVGTPSFTWDADRDMGLYRIGDDNLGITLNGVKYFDISTTLLDLGVGLTFTLDNSLDIGVSGATRPRTIYTGTDVIAGDKLKWLDSSAFLGILAHANTSSRTYTFQDLDGTVYQTGGTDVTITDGGTGASTATEGFDNLAPTTTKGDVIAHNGADNVRLPVGGDGTFLKADSGATAGVSWDSITIDLTTDVTGILPIANGGTNASNTTAAFDNLSPLTTKGDLLGHNGTDNVRVAVGTNNYQVIAASASTAGFKWDFIEAVVYKTANEGVTNSDVLQNDDELLFTIAANEVWVGELTLFCDADGAGADIRCGWSVPAGGAWKMGVAGEAQSVFSTSAAPVLLNQDATIHIHSMRFYISNGATPGTAQMQWAQVFPSAFESRVQVGSFIRAHKVL